MRKLIYFLGISVLLVGGVVYYTSKNMSLNASSCQCLVKTEEDFNNRVRDFLKNNSNILFSAIDDNLPLFGQSLKKHQEFEMKMEEERQVEEFVNQLNSDKEQIMKIVNGDLFISIYGANKNLNNSIKMVYKVRNLQDLKKLGLIISLKEYTQANFEIFPLISKDLFDEKLVGAAYNIIRHNRFNEIKDESTLHDFQDGTAAYYIDRYKNFSTESYTHELTLVNNRVCIRSYHDKDPELKGFKLITKSIILADHKFPQSSMKDLLAQIRKEIEQLTADETPKTSE